MEPEATAPEAIHARCQISNAADRTAQEGKHPNSAEANYEATAKSEADNPQVGTFRTTLARLCQEYQHCQSSTPTRRMGPHGSCILVSSPSMSRELVA